MAVSLLVPLAFLAVSVSVLTPAMQPIKIIINRIAVVLVIISASTMWAFMLVHVMYLRNGITIYNHSTTKTDFTGFVARSCFVRLYITLTSTI